MTTEIKTPAPPPAPLAGTFRPALPPPARELRTTLVTVGAGLLAALTWSLWQRTGSRLSLFVFASTLAAALVDIVWAMVSTKRVAVSVTANPAEVVVGDGVAIALAVAGPRQFLDVRIPALGAAGERVDVPDDPLVRGVAGSRQVATALGVEITGRGVAGFITCVRRLPVPLRRPLYIGPRAVPAAETFPELYRTWGEGQARPAPTGDLVRGVRPYVAGDPMRRVHWRATARDLAGDLVVKEVEETGAPRLWVVLDLGNGGAAGEGAAARAAWYAEEGLRRGYDVVLSTAERRPPPAGASPAATVAPAPTAGGPGDPYRAEAVAVTGPVRSPSDVLRRLAAAGAPGKPELPRPDEPGGVVVVTDRGDTWR